MVLLEGCGGAGRLWWRWMVVVMLVESSGSAGCIDAEWL
jgi:hypothetical protein